MTQKNDEIKNNILQKALPNVIFDGWTDDLIERASIDAGYDTDMPRAVFPEGVRDVLDYFSQWADTEMLKALEGVDIENLRIRDRITLAVERRLEILFPHKEAVRTAMNYWSMPPRGVYAKRAMWRTSDVIWNWAGDTSTDYNRYTKRGLLVMVISSTFFYWLQRQDSDLMMVKSFLHRRIDNVLKLGKGIGKLKSMDMGGLGDILTRVKTNFSTRF